MRCPDDSDQSRKVRIRVLDSDQDTQQFYFDAPMQNPNADAYRTVRNADPDADAGSEVRCCAVPHLTKVPVRGRTRESSNGVPHLFLAEIVKTLTDPLKGRSGSAFSFKISCLNFSKAVGCDANPDPDLWVRIRKKIHQNRKCK